MRGDFCIHQVVRLGDKVASVNPDVVEHRLQDHQQFCLAHTIYIPPSYSWVFLTDCSTTNTQTNKQTELRALEAPLHYVPSAAIQSALTKYRKLFQLNNITEQERYQHSTIIFVVTLLIICNTITEKELDAGIMFSRGFLIEICNVSWTCIGHHSVQRPR